MYKLFTLTALSAALTLAATTTASARTQTQSANHSRVAYQQFQSQQQTYALTGQTAGYDRADRPQNRYASLIKGGRSAR